MGQWFTNPGTALLGDRGQTLAIGNPNQILAESNRLLQQQNQGTNIPELQGLLGARPDVPSASIGRPSFLDAARAGAPVPGGVNALSPGLSKAGKLATFLQAGLQGALAGEKASEQAVIASGGRRAGGFGLGAEAGYTLPFVRATQQQGVERGALENQMLKANMQPVTTPYGTLPWFRATQLAQLNKELAETRAKGFVTPRGGGVYDINQGAYAPGAGPTPSTPEAQAFAYLLTQNNPATGNLYTRDEALQHINAEKAQTKQPVLDPNKVAALNDIHTQRYQVLNPGQALPPSFLLSPGATQQDYDRVDKGLTQLESAQGTKAQRETANALRQQSADLAKQNQQDREEQQGRKWVTWVDPETQRTVAGPVSLAKQLGAQNPADLDTRDVQAVQDARGAVALVNKRGDPSSPGTWGVSQLIDSLEKDGKLGIGASRVNSFLAGKVGTLPDDDPRIMALLNKTQLLMTLSMKAHFGASGGRSPQMLAHFMSMANAKVMDGPALRAGVNSVADYMGDRAMLPGARPAGGPAPVGGLRLSRPRQGVVVEQ